MKRLKSKTKDSAWHQEPENIELVPRKCLGVDCGKEFMAHGRFQRLCPACHDSRVRNHRRGR